MRELKKLFQAKRVLALALAIAMAVTMLPTTAYAAPSADSVSEEQSTAVDSVDGEASESQADEGADAGAPDGNTEADDSLDDGSAEVPKTDASDDTPTDDPGVTADDAAAGNPAGTGTDQETEGEGTGPAAEEEVKTADGAVPEKDVYEVDDSNVGDTTAVYDGSEQFGDAQVVIKKNGESVDETDIAGLTKKWVKKDTSEEVSPVAAGEYQLLVTIPAGDRNDAVEKRIDFKITAQVLSVAEDSISVTPGTKVKDIKVGVSVVDKDGTTFASVSATDAEANAASKLAVTSAGVKEAITGNVLGNEDVLKKGGDYAITLSFQFTDKADEAEKNNYAMPADQVMDIEMSDLISTWVEWDYTAAYKAAHPVKDEEGNPIEGEYEPFTYAYTGSAQEPVAGTDYEAKIFSDEVVGKDDQGNDTYRELTGELKKVWYEYRPGSGRVELEQAPVNAGEYGIVLRYEGEEGLYDDCDSPIMDVTIEPAILELVPIPEGGTTFSAGTTAKEVLEQVDYQVYRYDEKAANGLGARFDNTDEFDRDTFWGTSYADSSKTQSYQPVFGILNEKKTTNEDGTTEDLSKWLKDGDRLESGKTYRVMFTGYKAVYNADGSISSQSYICPINAYGDGTDSDGNSYHVNLANSNSLNYMVDEEHVISSKEALIINVAAAAVIDVSAITPISREYNGKPLYENRADYKKAKVTVDGKSVAEGTASQLTYTWYEQDGTVSEPDTNADGSIKTDADGNPIYIEKPVWRHLGTAAKPKDAGTYRLLVSYYDSTHANASVQNEVIYEIRPRKIKVVPSGDYRAYTGVTSQKFLSMTDVSYDIKVVTEDEDAAAMNEILHSWVKDDDYGITWYVEKKDAEKNEWNRTGNSYSFAEGDQLRLAAVLSYCDSNYTDYEEVEEKAEDGTTSTKTTYFNETKDITLTKMGAAALTVTTDLTKLADKSRVYNGEAFDVTEAVNNGLITIKAGETVVTNTVLPKMDQFWVEITGEGPEYVEKPVDAGTYKYYLGFGGDETYQGFIDNSDMFEGEDGFIYSNFVYETDIVYEIKQAELTVTPSIRDEVAGGTRVQYAYDVNAAVFETPVEKDKDAFTYRRYEEDGSFTYGYQAVDGTISFDVFDAKGRELTYGEKLKGAETYTVKFDSAKLTADYARNYTLKAGESKTFTTVRSKSTVTATSPDRNNAASIKINDVVVSKDGAYTHTVTTLQAIPYVYNLSSPDDKHREGNYIAIDIAIPAEYEALSDINPMYESSVKSAKGLILDVAGDNSIRVAFDAKEAEKAEFDIRWEEGFTEHFVLDFANAIFGDNLKETVAPKSLAFNGALNKMVVGATQRLDVKLSKSQESDVIHLSYKVDEAGKDFLCVTEEGYVTALKKGSATVYVYSSRLKIDEDGKQTWIPTEPAKEAKLKVTINDVTAPKIKTLTARDHSLIVSWSGPVDGYTDGYRSEIYVMKDKKKPQDFEEQIGAMKNGAWKGIFEIAPVYVSNNSYYNSKTKLYTKTLSGSGLSTEETYTVYVRNVSGIRGLDYCDHEVRCKVSESYAGAVKTAKTTKSQLTGLRFDQERITDTEYTEYDKDGKCYTVALSKGRLTMALEGEFRENVESGAADQEDRIWKDLPLSKDDQKNYMTSKLIYCVGEARDTECYGKDKDGCAGVVVDYYDPEDDTWHNAHLYNTPLATIKNEKLTLNGVGKVAVVAIDPTTRGVHAVAFVNITAEADNIKGKTVKMQVGQSMSLYDMVTYAEGKKVLIGDFEKSIVVDEELKNVFEADERFELDGVMVKAVKEGKQPLNLTLKDSVVGTDKTAAVKLSVTGLDPVKKIQTTFVTDQFADLAFAYTGYAEAFRIQVKDARGHILQSKYVPRNSNIYNAKTKLYTYRIGNLTQKSKYDVTITALYGNLASKEAKGKIQTTLLPASYQRLDDMIKADPYYEGGVTITAPNNGNGVITECALYSGNVYTLGLKASEYNVGAKYAKTDTLTWTVTNKKVATVKANAGTYTASFKAVGAGSTFIEVRSKITKAVFARWEITVYPVANADWYHGDNEDLGQSPIPGTNPSENRASVTSVGNGSSVSVQKGQYKWFSFTASMTDVYTFSSNDGKTYAWLFYDTERAVIDRIGNSADRDILDSKRSEYARMDANGKKIKLAAGETVYFAVGYDKLADALVDTYVSVVGDNGGSGESDVRPAPGTASLSVGSPAYVSVTANQFKWVRFTASEAGTYRFYSTNNSGDPKAWFFTQSGKNYVDRQQGIDSDKMNSWSGSSNYGYGYDDDGADDGKNNFAYEIDNLSAGETVYLAVGYWSFSSSLSANVFVEKLY